MSAPINAPLDSEALAKEIAECLADTSTQWGSSRFVGWHRCRRSHALRHIDGLIPLGERPEYFGIGSLVHAGINYMQRGVMRGEAAPRNWEDVINAAASAQPPEVCDEAWRLLGAYFAHWGTTNAGWDDAFEIVGAEQHWQQGEACAACGGSGFAPHRAAMREQQCGACDGRGYSGPFALPYTGRADTVLKMPDGTILIPDTKTRRARLVGEKESREDVARDCAAHPQFLGLAWLAMRALGLEEPPAIWVNAIVKTKIPTFDRLFVKITQSQIARWVEDHADEALQMREDLRGGRWSRLANRSQCASDAPGARRCEYFDYCHAESEELRAKKYATASNNP